MADVFVLIDDSLAFAGFDRVGDDLIREFASFLRGLGLVLRSDGEFILLVAGNLPFFGDVFGDRRLVGWIRGQLRFFVSGSVAGEREGVMQIYCSRTPRR